MSPPRLRSMAIPLALALVLLGSACGWLDRNSPPERTASPIVISPDGATKASGSVRFITGHQNFHSGVPNEVIHVVALEREGERNEVEIARYSDGYLGTPKEEFAQAAKVEMDLVFAEDAHAVSVSTDGGKSFAYVVLDEGAPFVCHKRATSRTMAPTRDLVLSALRESVFGDKNPLCDFGRTVRYVGEHAKDREITRAFTEAFVRSPELVSETLNPILHCLRALARDDASVRATLVAALDGRSATTGQIADALDRVNDPEAQSALATILAANVSEDAPGRDASLQRERLAWALASVTARRGEASTAVRRILVDLARSGTSKADPSLMKRARVHAIFGMAKLGPEEARILGELATSCTEAAIPRSLPAEPMSYETIEARSVACFAKDALAGTTR